ncbi:helicase-exonuclease AddAB subunit AddA [Xylanibacillus composti]|uniref:helicase-exonuclease AddAB subunit AddA n=1 Tax=Xylanibacillus composti TaxID=1572762 RepID=UPI001BD04465
MSNQQNTTVYTPVPKPPDVTWTDEQWAAITARGTDILVAAAAGSGKTAVLVERIIRRVLDTDNPVDIDRMLVSTFTKAAADEMRGRIREALEGELEKNPDSPHIRRQLALIHRASITTLHAFCMEVISQHYEHIPLDPGFRIAGEHEAELLRTEAMETLLESSYETKPEDSLFWQLVDVFGGERSDADFMNLALRLHEFSRSHPWPSHWLADMAQSFADAANDTQLNHWTSSLFAAVRQQVDAAMSLLRRAIDLCAEPGGPIPYADQFQSELEMAAALAEACEQGEWETLYNAFQSVAFSRLKPCRGDEYDKSLQEKAAGLRKKAKEKLEKASREWFARTPDEMRNEVLALAPLMGELAGFVEAFDTQYAALKRDKGLLDFSDLEHLTLRILRHPDSTPAHMLPSDAALAFREQFAEVLVDEYQDTNLVQETILSLLSGGAGEQAGSRFMVGDVKQSIYRFRLADPGLFLGKYKRFTRLDSHMAETGPFSEQEECLAEPGTPVQAGLRIDLARNFRSRQEVVDAVNFLFRQMMREQVAEIEYDESAELKYGHGFPQPAEGGQDLAVELLVVDREEEAAGSSGTASDESSDSESEDVQGADEDASELLAAQLEARIIARRIRQLIGADGSAPMQVYDKKLKGCRPLAYRDVVVLLRATQQWAPEMLEEFRLMGIPAFADLQTGYFRAGEVEWALALLSLIDNPQQDIPLAAVLRSPVVGLQAEELAAIRAGRQGMTYYDAVVAYAAAEEGARTELQDRLSLFLQRLQAWREQAAQGALSTLIWDLYRETGLYDFAGGLPGGAQRQANLRALYDRARQYEATSFRGLFRFLRFIEKIRDSGSDLGAARALGEQEDVVRIMSIHKSKGLEFPVVFVAGLGKKFNQQDARSAFLLHKELGFGPKVVDRELHVSYPSLPYMAIRHRMRMEMLAEEMRILYVALTRPKEKLILIGTVQNREKALQQWEAAADITGLQLPSTLLAEANSFLDWLGPCLIRHPASEPLRRQSSSRQAPEWLRRDTSRWKVAALGPDAAGQAAPASEWMADERRMAAIRNNEPLPDWDGSAWREELGKRLDWHYPYRAASALLSKTSVSELKRMGERHWQAEAEDYQAAGVLPDGTVVHSDTAAAYRHRLLRRPRFVEERGLSAVEKGTVYHAVMQAISLTGPLSEETVLQELERMRETRMLRADQLREIDPGKIAAFFASELGRRMLASSDVRRELPFSYALPVEEVYGDIDDSLASETVLMQGVIDCLFRDEQGWVLLDYKTDSLRGRKPQEAAEAYRTQLKLYAQAIERIWGEPVSEKYVFLFDGGHVVQL